MPRDIAQIVADLEALAPLDFDDSDPRATGRERLDPLCDELRSLNNVSVAAPPMFRAMERLDGVDLGSPGPLVHALEAMAGYEPFLDESVRRKPTALTVWMVNRILNSRPSDPEKWHDLLRTASHHSHASATTRDMARRFLLRHQPDVDPAP